MGCKTKRNRPKQSSNFRVLKKHTIAGGESMPHSLGVHATKTARMAEQQEQHQSHNVDVADTHLNPSARLCQTSSQHQHSRSSTKPTRERYLEWQISPACDRPQQGTSRKWILVTASIPASNQQQSIELKITVVPVWRHDNTIQPCIGCQLRCVSLLMILRLPHAECERGDESPYSVLATRT